MSMSTRYASWLAILGAAAFAAGCGAVRGGFAAHQTPRQQAAADAASLLAAFGPPPGAVRSGRLAVSSLAQEPDMPMAPDELTRTWWYRAPGAWQAVFAWIVAHPPAGLTLISSSGVTVGWVPARPAAETIPASARIVTISPDGGTVPSAADHQVTVTDPALVARIAAAVNGLPVYRPRDPMWCDIALRPGSGPAMRLVFRATAGSRKLAVVTAYQELCQLVNVVAGGKTMPSLDGAQSLIQQVMAIAGVRWPDFPAPGPTTTPTADP